MEAPSKVILQSCKTTVDVLREAIQIVSIIFPVEASIPDVVEDRTPAGNDQRIRSDNLNRARV